MQSPPPLFFFFFFFDVLHHITVRSANFWPVADLYQAALGKANNQENASILYVQIVDIIV